MQINKSDRNDAVGIARIMQCGWYKEVRVKDLDSHAVKALLVSRALVKIRRDLENQIRGLLKNLGLVIGPAKMNVFALRVANVPAGTLALVRSPLALRCSKSKRASHIDPPASSYAIMRRARPRPRREP
jgi:transposase